MHRNRRKQSVRRMMRMGKYRTARMTARKAKDSRGGRILSNAVFVESHADGGVHSYAFERANLSSGGNSACGDNRKLRGGAQRAEPCKIGAPHGAFAIHIGAKESTTKGLQRGHHFRWSD